MENKYRKQIFPFVELEGQNDLKLAIILNLIDPKINGVLIRGEKGTGKSTAVRGIEELLSRNGRDMKVVELPINATEDRVVGTLDIEKILKNGERKLQKGILHEADKNILYIDEVNLLEDFIVDLILDAAAMGVNTIEREGISYSHSSDFVLIGTMNPEEGELRPQLLDRFGLMVDVVSEKDKNIRKNIIKKYLEFSKSPNKFIEKFSNKEKELVEKIYNAKENLENITIDEDILDLIVSISSKLQVDGHRADLTMIRAAIALAAFEGDNIICEKHIERLLPMVYSHRLRKRPFEEIDKSKISSPELLKR